MAKNKKKEILEEVFEEPVVVEEEVVEEEELVEDDEEEQPAVVEPKKVAVQTWNNEVVIGVDNRIMNGRLYKDVRTVQATYLVSPEEFENGVKNQ